MSDFSRELASNLLAMSDQHLDVKMKPLIQAWGDAPTPMQVLEVLDQCVHGSLASGFVVKVLGILFDMTCDEAGVSPQTVMGAAPWRQDPAATTPDAGAA